VDRMTIVGTDGKERYLVEGEAVADIAAVCSMFLRDGHHAIDFYDGRALCCTCGQAVHELNIKGEKVVY
jgi:hypothetical protein